MKPGYILLAVLCFVNVAIADDSLAFQNDESGIQQYEEKIKNLENELEKYRKSLLEETIVSYKQTNDRINNYLTFISLIAALFAVIIAVGGIFIGFESIKSRRRRDEAISTLEKAKEYVESKKSTFDETIDEKFKELEEEYQKYLNLFTEHLLEDIDSETQRLKDLTQKKAQEIEEYSVEEKADEKIESLQNRIEFFESIGIPEDPKILLSKAKLLSEKEMHHESIELLEKLVEKEPEESRGYWQLGWEYSKLNQHEKSIKYYKKCIEIDPENSSAYNNLAIGLENSEQPYDALKNLDKAIELNKSRLYLRNKGRILEKLNSYDEALTTYEELLETDDPEAIDYDRIIEFLKRQGRLKDTIEYYDLAIKNIEDKNQHYNASKALTLKELEEYEEAINILQNLIDQDYKPEQCYMEIAEIKYQQNKKEEAISILDSAISLNPKYSTLYFKKAGLQITDDEDDALQTINDGSDQIEGERYFQSAGRYFMNLGYFDFAQKLYTKANELIYDKLSDKKEVDILNYFEGLILTESHSKAEDFLNEYSDNIVNKEYSIVKDMLKLCFKVAQGKIDNLTEHALQFGKYVQDEDFEKIGWNFNDILYWIKPKIDDDSYEILLAIKDVLREEITLDNFKSGIENFNA